MGRKIDVQETANKDSNFCQAIFAPPSKWRPWQVQCLPYPRYATDQVIELLNLLSNLRNKTCFQKRFPNTLLMVY